MKNILIVCAMIGMTLSTQAMARDDRLKFPFEEFLKTEKAKEALLDIPVFFAGQQHGAVEKKWGEATTSRKTNAFNKSDQEACQWVLLSALKSLQERAIQEGMNAVINIKSNYKHQEFVSSSEFECGAGTFVAGVALKADIVKLVK
ncbi:excinuclease ABC subunit A [Neptunicella sp. SCSIO 80796]|uniref:excinuclease ABC subunit A n=1 Tax=Neptunicella plasticusilytica TaxID=3117012 RepID=UPI003A4D3F27